MDKMYESFREKYYVYTHANLRKRWYILFYIQIQIHIRKIYKSRKQQQTALDN